MKANQLSRTAAFVAVKFYGLTQDEKFRSLFDKSTVTFYDKLVQSLPAPIRYYHFWLKFSWIRQLYIWSEELLLPGDLLHVIARKWFIQRMTDELLEEGYEQLIVLGAGFDHLAYHFAQKGIASFEFDAPYMAELKRRFLDEKYEGNLHPKIISSHFPRDQIGRQLAEQSDIDPQKKTIIVAEGFFDYLSPVTVSSSLNQIRNYFSNNTALVSTHFALDELSPFHRRVFSRSVQMVGEQLQLDTSIAGFKEMLIESGFNISQLYGSQEIRDSLHHQVKTDLPILEGFYILTAV